MYSTANLSDKELKDQGNRLFSLRKYEDAVSCYTKAIVRVHFGACFATCKLFVYFLNLNVLKDMSSLVLRGNTFSRSPEQVGDILIDGGLVQ